MRVTVAKKIAAENGMSLEYNNDMRLYILKDNEQGWPCLLYTSPSPRDRQKSRMPSSA